MAGCRLTPRVATMSEPGDRVYDSRRIGADAGPREDHVAVEEPMEVRVNGAPFAVVMRTPGADRDLAAGFLLAEDVIRDGDEIGLIEYCLDADDEGRGNVLNVTVLGDAVARLDDRLANRRQVMMTASCGLCGRRTIESLRARVPAVTGGWSVSAAVVTSLPPALRRAQRVFESTGGLHAAGLFDLDGRLLSVAEAVGRASAALADDSAGVRPHLLRARAEGAAGRDSDDLRSLGAIEPGDRPGAGSGDDVVRLRSRRFVQRLRQSRTRGRLTLRTPIGRARIEVAF
jgi:formate dehydrogenase accessory protein FdhD